MSFTDEDLKRLKKYCKDLFEGDPTGYFDGEKLGALINRLEAAEKFIEHGAGCHVACSEAWRKSKGE